MRKGRSSPEFEFAYWRGKFAERPEGYEENVRMAPVERDREAQLISEATHAAAGEAKAEFRPAGEIIIPASMIGNIPVPDQDGRRDPNSVICQLVQRWKEGKIT